jgi:GNAT superfamily N-acetyltransferase
VTTAAGDRGPLSDLLVRIEQGERLPADPWLSMVPPDGHPAVLSFPGHVVIAADLDPAWVRSRLPDDDLSAPLNPPFLHACERQLGLRTNNLDGLYLAPPRTGPLPLELRQVADLDHPRVHRAQRYRSEVRIFTTAGGVLVVGRGVAGRWEVSIEIDPAHRGRGLGRTLAAAARHLATAARPLWAQVAPGNAASVRAFLAAGYRPVGAEALLVP